MVIREKTALEVWKKSLKFIIDKGKDFIDTDGRVCRESLNLYIEITNSSEGILKPIEIIEDFKKWFYPPRSEIANIMLLKKLAPGYSYTPGTRIFSYRNKLNQIDDFVIPLLKKDPNSRRAVISLWDPLNDANVHRKDTPSMISIDFKLRKGKLNLTMMIRSNDIFMGWPANVYQLSILQKDVCEKLNVEPGFIGIFSNSAHIFKDKFDDIKEIIGNIK